jgi:hypothetical protein
MSLDVKTPGDMEKRMHYMPDMRRNIFDPSLILYNTRRNRGEPVYDELPSRVTAVLERLDRQERERALLSRRDAPVPVKPGFMGKVRSSLRRFLP